jgi:hypothetical protein
MKINRNFDYSAKDLPKLLSRAFGKIDELYELLYEIQESTGIPGFHGGESDGHTIGVLERLQGMHDAGECSLGAFKSFDQEEA